MEVDHEKPHSKFHDESIGNLVTACKECNRSKSDNTNWKSRDVGILGKALYWVYPMLTEEASKKFKEK